LAVSLEVAEHLPAGRAESFVKNLTDAADAVLFGAAIPGQKGVGHLNLRWQSYWASLFKAQGLDAFDPIRPCVWNDERVCWWYRQNTLLYARDTVVSRMPALRATHAKNLDMVHPQCYLQRTDVDELGFVAVTKLLPSLIGDAIGRRVTDKKSKGRQDQSSQVGAAEGSTFD
jgi:hypothetical protein